MNVRKGGKIEDNEGKGKKDRRQRNKREKREKTMEVEDERE
jgi:hypothetical protein